MNTPNAFTKKFNDLVRDAKTQKNWNYEKISEELGISVGTITNWIKGKSYPDVNQLIVICDVFNIPDVNILIGTKAASATNAECEAKLEYANEKIAELLDRLEHRDKKYIKVKARSTEHKQHEAGALEGQQEPRRTKVRVGHLSGHDTAPH